MFYLPACIVSLYSLKYMHLNTIFLIVVVLFCFVFSIGGQFIKPFLRFLFFFFLLLFNFLYPFPVYPRLKDEKVAFFLLSVTP